MILESVEHGPLLWPTIEEDGVTRVKKYSELSAAEAIQTDYDVKATNIILQGLPPEERECKLYDEFDKFAYRKGETHHDFNLRFSLLLNDMNMYNMKLEQFQVKTKFLNTLPPEWSKFVTDVKLVRDLHTTNIDQLHAYLGQHEYHANEVRLMHERTSDPLALVLQHQLNKPTYQHHKQSYHQPQFQQQASTYQSSPFATSYHTLQFVSKGPSSSNLSIFYPVNDIPSTVNHNSYMASSSAPQIDYAPMVHHSSEFSSPETGLVVLLRTSSNPRQQATINNGRVTIQPIQGRQNFMSAGSSRQFASGSCRASGKQRVIVCYNFKGEGHMSKQCTKPKRKRDAKLFKDKVLIFQAQANGHVLQEEELEFLADPRTAESLSNQNIALMANLSHYGSDNLAEINQDNKQVNELLTAELERYKNQERVLKEQNNDDKASTSYEPSLEIKTLKHTLSEHLKEKESLEQMITLLKNDFQKEVYRNIDRELALEKQVKELNNIVFKRNQSAQTVHILTKPQVFYNHSTRQALGFQNPCYLKKAQQLKLKLYDGSVIEKSNAIVIPDTEETLLLAEESLQTDEPNLSANTTIVEVPKELPKVSMVNSCLKKLKFHLASFDTVVKERTTATTITKGTWGFEHTKACFCDDIIPFVKALKELVTSFDQCLIDEVTEVQNVFKQIELARNTLSSPESAPTFAELFKINDLKAQAQAKDTVILKLKEKLHSLSGDVNERNVKREVKEIETLNIELDHKEKVLVITALKEHLNKLKGKAVITEDVSLNLIDPELLNVDVAPLALKLRKNKTAHTDYIRHTQEEAVTLREIVKSEKLLNPLNTSLDYALTPKNKTKQIRLTEQITKSIKTTVTTPPSANIDSNTPVISSTGVTLVSSASGSLSQDNTKKNRIRRTQRKAKKNKLEDHLRTVKSSLNKKTVVDTKATLSVVQIVLWYLDSGCSKHMTGDRSQLVNFIHKFLGTVKFGNDHVAKIIGYGDYQIGNVTISWVYYVERLGHNLFSVGQFCDSDLEVAFR
uniref:Integrase, catalytic region, zinc finger, CCHC-type, peptidase aspartic, catalytic n=1 Tax=Tanacetum cinerariifolium TaxID=118510 RepID=A0A699IEF9_TANCI|nr:integrase, catalytic region, zinc finger, CCHC-type, peptidase aspartic, catalytic [Tanacetum cinerariifolium]